MINLAVIEMKDIIKYLVRITIVVAVVVVLTRYFLEYRTNLQNQTTQIQGESFLSCLDVTIPGMKEINGDDEEELYHSTGEELKSMLSVELGMLDNLKPKEEVSEGQNENQVQEESKEEETEKLQEAQTGLETQVQNSNVPENFSTTYHTVKIKNGTNIKLTEEILKPNVKINAKNILIYHTHSCESYTPSEKYTYKASGNFRTIDKKRSVIRVGTELTKYMKSYGYNVIHDTTLYDYPSYSGSYNRSYTGVSKLLNQHKETEVLFDIHRDAIADSSYAPTVKIGNEYAAQLMFVIGSNGSGAQHDNWQKNLQFAIKIQEKANEMYPGLFKPIVLRNSRYNQQLANGASIIEVGATGNTLEQCLVSMKYLAKVLTEI